MEDVLKENQPETAIELIYGSGATLTVTPPWPDMTFPKTFLIEFGDGVTDLTGNVRTGSIEVVATVFTEILQLCSRQHLLITRLITTQLRELRCD